MSKLGKDVIWNLIPNLNTLIKLGCKGTYTQNDENVIGEGANAKYISSK